MRPRWVLLGLLLALLPAPLAAQEDLRDVLDSLASLWARGDAVAIGSYTAAPGVEFELYGDPMGSLAGRKLSAALRQLFQDRETVAVVASMTSRVAGVEDRAFGELTWDQRPRGASLPERSTVFLALVREQKGWRVTQIRIMP